MSSARTRNLAARASSVDAMPARALRRLRYGLSNKQGTNRFVRASVNSAVRLGACERRSAEQSNTARQGRLQVLT